MIGFEEFRSMTVDAIGDYAQAGLDGKCSERHALRLIEQACIESSLKFEDGDSVSDDVLRERLREHYGDERKLTWEQTRIGVDDGRRGA